MRRRWMLALVLATALIFTLAGTAIGYWIVPGSEKLSAECRFIQNRLDDGFEGATSSAVRGAMDYYNDNCR